jgi:hypothetical protein
MTMPREFKNTYSIATSTVGEIFTSLNGVVVGLS